MTASNSSRMTASEFVADTLRREILRGDLLPRQPLLQDHIAARFEVSQSSVREALRRLEALSLVTSIRNRGTFVSTLSPEQVDEMYDIRIALEVLALRHNFGKLSPEKLREAQELLAEMEKNPDTSFFLGETHQRFHSIFYDHGERKLGRDILQNIYGNLTRLWVDFIRKKPRVTQRYEADSHHEHRQLLAAIKAGDLAKAEQVLTRHINRAREELVSYLRQAEAGAAAAAKSAAVKPVKENGKRRKTA